MFLMKGRLPRERRVRTAVLAILATGVAWASLGSTPALADPYPVDGGPDRGQHSYCFDGAHPMNTDVHTRALSTMANVDAQTAVTTVQHTPCRARTDVRFQQRPISPGVIGYAPCAARVVGSTDCDIRDVRVYWAEIERLSAHPKREARHTLCHEVGHTLGASHYESWLVNPDGTWATNSCMISGLADDGSLWTRSYGPHHIAHINAWFS